MVSSLQNIPEELILKVVDAFDGRRWAGRFSLRQLSRTCRRLRRVCLTEVYHTVCVRRPGTKTDTANAGVFVSHTKIDDFVDYISKPNLLLPHLRHLRINWAPEFFPNDPVPPIPMRLREQNSEAENSGEPHSEIPPQLYYIQQLIRSINLQEHRKVKIHFFADFTSRSQDFSERNQDFYDWMLPLLNLDPFQVLEIILPERPADSLVFACYRKKGLKQLILSRLDVMIPFRKEPELDLRPTIEKLTVRAIRQHRPSMTAALDQPAQLKSLHLEFQEDDTDLWYDENDVIEPDIYAEALLGYKKTLEEVFWSLSGWSMGQWGVIQTMRVLRRLPLLKRVGLPTSSFRSLDEAGRKRRMKLSRVLPSSLEQLQIEVDGKEAGLEWTTWAKGPMTPDALDFIDWLSDVPRSKPESLPKVRELVLWRGPRMPPNREEIKQFVRACDAQSIAFSSHFGEQPPLFGTVAS